MIAPTAAAAEALTAASRARCAQSRRVCGAAACVVACVCAAMVIDVASGRLDGGVRWELARAERGPARGAHGVAWVGVECLC